MKCFVILHTPTGKYLNQSADLVRDISPAIVWDDPESRLLGIDISGRSQFKIIECEMTVDADSLATAVKRASIPGPSPTSVRVQQRLNALRNALGTTDGPATSVSIYPVDLDALLDEIAAKTAALNELAEWNEAVGKYPTVTKAVRKVLEQYGSR